MNAYQSLITEENRENVLLEIYPKLDETKLKKIISFGSPETGKPRSILGDRAKYADQFEVNSSILRLMIDYDRYDEANSLVKYFHNKIDFLKMRVLDFGSGAGDYGVLFAKLGCQVTFYDFTDLLICPQVRCKRLNLNASFKICPDETILNEKYDLIIFSEVLEHIDDPLTILKDCKTKFIFSTAYPYIPEVTDYFNHTGHSALAQKAAKSCRDFLSKNYTYINLEKRHLHEIKNA